MSKTIRYLSYIGNLQKLSATELMYMEMIWKNKEETSSEEIYKRFPVSTGAVSTILQRLTSKGYLVNVQKGRHHIYFSQVSELDYKRALIEDKIQRTFEEKSLESLISAFCGSKLSEQKSAAIREFFDKIEKED